VTRPRREESHRWRGAEPAPSREVRPEGGAGDGAHEPSRPSSRGDVLTIRAGELRANAGLPLPRAARRASTVFGEDRRRAGPNGASTCELGQAQSCADVRWRMEFD
jgi:hypothetical protein